MADDCHYPETGLRDWPAHITALMSCSGMSQAMIYHVNGTRAAGSAGASLRPGEADNIVEQFKSTTGFQNGFRVNQKKFSLIDRRHNEVTGELLEVDAEFGRSQRRTKQCTLFKAYDYIVIGLHNPGSEASQCKSIICACGEDIRKYVFVDE